MRKSWKRFKRWLTCYPKLYGCLSWANRWRRQLVAVTVVVAHILGALTSVRAIMEVRTAQGAVAWAISLNTMPYVAVPAYWVFGRTGFRGYVTARRDYNQRLEAFWNDFHQELRDQDLIFERDRTDPFVSEALAKLPATTGNDVELLIDGDATFDSIFAGIDRAEDYVLVQFYIIRDDEVGRELRDRLVARAKAGVRCYVLYDEFGSRLSPEYKAPLLEAGAQIIPFNTTQGPTNRFQLNFRNHRKIVIADGREAWVGGLNVGREYKGLDPKFGYWRDTHLRVAGPIVQCVQVGFVEDWHWATKRMLGNLQWTPKPADSGASVPMLCLPSGPVDQLETCTLFFLYAIQFAQERLWIASPYFVPDEQFISALQIAALRGVDVRILIPDEADSALVNLSAWSYMKELQDVGIKVYRYTKGFMHHKVMLIDDAYCTVGTANFDNRSFRLNFELTMGIHDRDFTSRVAEMLEVDFSHARLVQPGELEQRSLWYRFWVRAARLAAPVQ